MDKRFAMTEAATKATATGKLWQVKQNCFGGWSAEAVPTDANGKILICVTGTLVRPGTMIAAADQTAYDNEMQYRF